MENDKEIRNLSLQLQGVKAAAIVKQLSTVSLMIIKEEIELELIERRY